MVITYTVSNDCDATTFTQTCDQPVIAAPVETDFTCPTPAAVSCSAAQALTIANYADITFDNGETGGCLINYTAEATGVNTSGIACDGSGVVVITYTVSNDCDATTFTQTCDQPVLAAPVEIDFTCPTPAAVSCSEAQLLTTADYADITFDNGETGGCMVNYTASATDVDLTGIACDGSGVVVITYTVSNDCDATTFTQTCDQPVLAAPVETDFICPTPAAVSCSEAAALTIADYADITFDNGATDGCLINYTATATGVNTTGITCDGIGVVLITYTVSNDCDATTFT